MAGEEQTDDKKTFRLMRLTDINNVPCARSALLHGSGGYAVAGLAYFLATSRIKRSVDVGLAGFILTTLGSWFYCRYKNAQMRIQQRMIGVSIKNKLLYEGTNLDPTSKPESNDSGDS